MPTGWLPASSNVRIVVVVVVLQGSHAYWKFQESIGFFLKIPGPAKSWKITLVLESLGN